MTREFQTALDALAEEYGRHRVQAVDICSRLDELIGSPLSEGLPYAEILGDPVVPAGFLTWPRAR
ncbi:hypothetical protein AB0J63_12450 [Streptosporangium canum]|uniref:hypothetical protein n=1 Tax=Streptosporangium canum TaxID=324952 RepID=UPI00341431A6